MPNARPYKTALVRDLLAQNLDPTALHKRARELRFAAADRRMQADAEERELLHLECDEETNHGAQ